MTEAEWLNAKHSVQMLEYLRPHAPQRRFLLFAVACSRRVWQHIPDGCLRQAVATIELFADGEVTDATRYATNALAHRATVDYWRPLTGHRPHHERAVEYAVCAAAQTTNTNAVGWGYFTAGFVAACGAALCSACTMKFVARSEKTSGRPVAKKERRIQAALLRDIFGNPFRPVDFDAEWRTSTAVALAKEMYESRDFSAMPILADALQDAGCNNDDVLNHCRGTGPHVRGCWVVDLLLGKA